MAPYRGFYKSTFLEGGFFNLAFILAGLVSQTLNAQDQLDQKTISEQTLIIPTDLNCDLPPDWSDPQTTPLTFILSVDGDAPILVNGQQMNPYDVVGAFYRNEDGLYLCGGFSCLPESGAIGIVAFGDDPFTPEKDGFEFGDQMVFKVHSWTCGKTFLVDSIAFDTLNPGANIVFPPAGTVITYISCTSKEECQITATNDLSANKAFYKAGQWNKFSTMKSNISVDELIALFGGKLIVVREANNNKMIWPEMNIYTLAEIIPGNEYLIKVSEDCWVELP